jgi:transcriptional regulator with XRE-family HTH domain
MFYDQYLELCAQKGVTPSKAALENGISKTSVTRWKNGAIPNANILEKLSLYFNVSTDYLLGNDQKERPLTEREEPTDLERLLEQQPGLMFHGAPLTEDDRAKLITAMHAVMAVEDKKHKK